MSHATALIESLWAVVGRYPECAPWIATESLRLLLAWNDPNGDYETMPRADLLAALRIQLEGAK